MRCARCGSETSATICPTCGASIAFEPPRADTDVRSDPPLASRAATLRAAGAIQLFLSVSFAAGGVVSYFRGLRPNGGPIIYIVFLFGSLFWFVASLQLRRQYRWAWWASVVIVGFLFA